MTAFGLGPLPGTDISAAADIVMGETWHLPHIPQLPQRGLGSDAVGRTAGLLEAVHVDRGPRSWQLSARPNLAMRQTWDRLERDLDAVQAVWGESVSTVKVQVTGPWTMAAAIELPNGHRVITDRGARNDLYAALVEGVEHHITDIMNRFGCSREGVVLQLDEPLVGQVIDGTLSGTTDFDTIPAVPAEVVAGALEPFGATYLNLAGRDRAGRHRTGRHRAGLDRAGLQHARQTPRWELVGAAQALVVDFADLHTDAQRDAAGYHLDKGKRLALTLGAGQPDKQAHQLVDWIDQLSLERELLRTHIDIVPWPVHDIATDYARAVTIARMLNDA